MGVGGFIIYSPLSPQCEARSAAGAPGCAAAAAAHSAALYPNPNPNPNPNPDLDPNPNPNQDRKRCPLASMFPACAPCSLCSAACSDSAAGGLLALSPCTLWDIFKRGRGVLTGCT